MKMNRNQLELFIIMLVMIALVLLYVVLTNTKEAAAQTDSSDPLQWASEFEGTFGGCCGKDDCFTVAARMLEDVGTDKVKIEVNGIQMVVPSKIVRASQDENDYWCHLTMGALEYGWSPDEFDDGVTKETPIRDCALGAISEACAHCIFIAVGN